MEYRTPSIRELSRGTYSVSGSSAAQLYSVPGLGIPGWKDPLANDPSRPSKEALEGDSIIHASQVGLGPGYATPLGGDLYERMRYDPGHRSHPSPHVNVETLLKDGPKGKNEKLNNRHITTIWDGVLDK